MRIIISLVLVSLLFSCTKESKFTQSDEEAINRIRKEYVEGWLDNDEEKVLNLFHGDAVIIPSGLSPIRGINDIKEYWFPKDSSSTIIHSYKIELLDLNGSDSLAYSLEKGVLNFTYTKGDFTMTKSSTSHASSIYRKRDDGSWKIISRMWTQLK